MSTPLPPDPYVALGLSKDATAAQIKTTYRKLVLKCHPDKVTDESKKAEASDQFHRIQQAYEILSDEGRKLRYDAQVKIAEQKKQSMSSRPPVEVRTAAYEVPTSGPGRGTFPARGPERVYEERRPSRADSDDYFGNGTRSASRKHDDYERQAKKTTVPPRDDRERARVVERERRDGERVTRTDKRRTRDQDTKRDRDRKYTGYADDSDGDLRYDAEKRKKAAEEVVREKSVREQERIRVVRERDEYERELASRRAYDNNAQHYSRIEDDAKAYQGRDKRPSLARSASTATKTETYVDRRPAPAFVRRHSTKPAAASPQPRRERDRNMSVPDIPETDERRPTSRPTPLYTSTSPPSSIKLPRGPPLRSTSMKMDERDVPPMYMPLRRSETDPNLSPRRPKDSKASTLRETDFSAGYPTPSASPENPPSPATHKYRYPGPDQSTSREDLNYRRPLERDYDRERDRRIYHSPEPMRSSKPSATPRYTAAPQPPPIRTNSTYSNNYTTESPTSYTNPRPSPIRRDTTRDYDVFPKVSTPKANSSPRYDSYPSERIVTDNLRGDYEKDRRRGSPIDIDGGYKKAPLPEDPRTSGYSTRRPSVSARPRMHRERPSEYSYTHHPQRAQAGLV